MDDLRIREAHVSDAEGIAKVHVYTWQSAYLGLIPDSFLQGLNVRRGTTNWTRNIETPLPQSHTLVAVISGEIVGFVGVGANREKELTNQGEIYAIYVKPEIQGRGIGAALMREGIQALKREGFVNAALWVLDGNLRTRAWYEARGWKSFGRSKLDQRGDLVLKEIEYRIEFTPDN